MSSVARVAPPVGAWIEIRDSEHYCRCDSVAPPVGAWIEIILIGDLAKMICVAPPVGAWIEIRINIKKKVGSESLPLWERGLKFVNIYDRLVKLRRSPCGSVD